MRYRGMPTGSWSWRALQPRRQLPGGLDPGTALAHAAARRSRRYADIALPRVACGGEARHVHADLRHHDADR